MRPTFFSIGPVAVDSYYVLWGVALCIMVLWTRRRAERIYGISFNNASDILIWVIAGVAVGAVLGGYLDHWTRYVESPIRILYFWESGLSSGPGFIGGGLAGLYKIRKLSVSVNSFAESASIPCASMLFVGRWGCFLNGCCQGISTDSSYGVRFPSNPSVRVFPSQLYESFASLIIAVILIFMERYLTRKYGNASRGAILWPAFCIMYGLYRFVFDFLRAGDRIFGLRVGQYAGLGALIIGVFWLFWSLNRMVRVSSAVHDGKSV
ncbi:MAG: prolipoprotein diacylglyceryl transferase [Synergistaceae bacterium]|jgi:phosphatidylglycerol:prolipoprotein diacylglycerol transferase|nr:prolipoprotein diacylglyceryl transferase [Synergistaceae bacterium]